MHKVFIFHNVFERVDFTLAKTCYCPWWYCIWTM